MSEWISVEHKRPPRGETVIWFHPKRMDSRGDVKLADYYRAECHDLPHRPATHWMPLPEPPK